MIWMCQRSAAIHRRYLSAVYRIRDYAQMLDDAHEALLVAFRRKGVLWWVKIAPLTSRSVVEEFCVGRVAPKGSSYQRAGESWLFFVHGGSAVALNRRQALFVGEYITDLNASRSALAGTARRPPDRLVLSVENLEIQAINQCNQAAAMKERGERTKITADKVLADIRRSRPTRCAKRPIKKAISRWSITQRRLRLASCRKAFADVD